jgi:tetratricopeptide (TPR) repeat protein
MLTDRYGYEVATVSDGARDAYVAGVDLLLAATEGAEQEFRRAIAIDEGFALAHAGLARTLQVYARMPEARAAMVRARDLSSSLPPRERCHIAMLSHLVEGNGAAALAAAQEHLQTYPRDAMVLSPCTSTLGLIGLSGRAGREAQLLALLDGLADAYGDDWWFGGMHAFAKIETGDVAGGLAAVERSLAINPRNAGGAHVRAHAYYEGGDCESGLRYLRDWLSTYSRRGQMHCHLNWHVALWQLELGQTQEAWETYRASLHPGASWGPPLHALADCASFLFRAEMAGEARQPELWRDLSAYAGQYFANPGVAFADIHSALAHALAGNADALAKTIDGAPGPAAEMVAPIARAFSAISRQEWSEASSALLPLMNAHEPVGGSRAQRDLIEYTLVMCLLRSGRSNEAQRVIQARRQRPGGWPLPQA